MQQDLTNNQFVCKQTLNDLAKLVKWLSCVVCTYLYDAFDCIFLSCHLCISEWIHTIYLPEYQIRHKIWSLSDCSKTETHNHLLRKRTLNHLAKLAKRLSCVVSTYLSGAFDSIFLLCHIHVLEWILTLWLPECQGTPCLKQVQNLKFKWHNETRTYNH